jgi:transcriptional regulator GlxA family with amidase domain
VATNLVLFLKRPGGQAQFSAQLSTQLAEREPLRELQAWIADHPGDPLTVPALAGRVAMSPRNFFRVFTHEVGVTPARFVQRARVEAACRLLQDTRRSADEIAAQCGFGSAETMRGAFQRALRTSPQAYRARFDAAPDGQRRHALDERGSLMDRMRRPAHDRLR